MSELIQKNDDRATIRWKLLTGASALALAMCAADATSAAPDEHPLFWIELGADADAITGQGDPFSPDFTLLSPTPSPYQNGNSPIGLQRPSHYTFGGEAKLTFQPEGSDWNFSAGIKYGRSNNKRNSHGQTNATIKFANPAYEHLINVLPSYIAYFTSILPTYTKYAPKFAHTTVNQSERHLVLDFQAGKDVGLGLFGRAGSSVLSAGLRVARFQSHSAVTVRARPDATFQPYVFPNVWGGGPHTSYTIYERYWHSYYMQASSERSFKGIGPSLSWNATMPLAGNVQKGELELDFGINGSVLFGKQKAKIHHHTTGRYFMSKYHHSFTTPSGAHHYDHYLPLYDNTGNRSQSRSVTVPNFGANIGLSYRIENTKLSLGYRSDYFFGAMDGGIDKAKKTTLGFNGLYASVSIGLGD